MISFLLSTTPDGATYLQVIILSVLLIVLAGLIINQIIEAVKYVKTGLNEFEDIELDTQELYQQINHHTPIDGYRVFAERQNGHRYTVTFLSKNNQRCVLAEVDDYTDPHGAIKIITF